MKMSILTLAFVSALVPVITGPAGSMLLTG